MDRVSLRTSLASVHRRAIRIGAAAAAGWAVLAGAIFLLVGVWLDLLWEMPPAMRIASSAAAAAVALALLLNCVVIQLRRSRSLALARRMDQLAASGGQIVTGVDLLNDERVREPLSTGLAELAIGRAAGLARKVSPRSVVPARPLARSFGSFAALCLVTFAIAMLMPRLARTQFLRFFDPFGDHPPYSRVLFQVDPGDANVLYGDGLDVRASTEGAPVERLQLVLNPSGPNPQQMPMFREPGGRWRATFTNVTEPGEYYVSANPNDSERSRRFRIGVITVPRLEQVRFRITLPAYTNRPFYEGPMPDYGLAGLPATSVTVWASSNRPLEDGRVALKLKDPQDDPGSSATEQRVQLKPTAPGSREVSGSFTLARPGRFELFVRDASGQKSRESFSGPITILADERPFVRIVQPQPISLATADVTLGVVMSAEDDYGIAHLALYRSLNDSRALPMPIDLDLPPPTRHEASVALPLSAYGLQPGDEIKLFARVEDTDPAGPKGAESPIVLVRIISQEQFARLLRQQRGLEVFLSKYQEAQRRLESAAEELRRLQEELKDLPPDSPLAEQKRNELKRLVKKMREDADQIREAMKENLPYDLDEKLSPQLGRLADQLAGAADELERLDSEQVLSCKACQQGLKDLAERLAGPKRDFEREATEPLEWLAKIFPLLEDAARFTALYQRQQSLADRMASLKDRKGEDDPALKARMRDLEAEQRSLRDDLRQLLDDIEDHVALLPDDPALDKLRQQATEFVAAVRASGASEAMSRAEAGLAEFSGTRGYQGAQEAAAILKRFIKQCNGGIGDEGRQCLAFQPALGSGLGNTIDQLLADLGFNSGMNPGMGMGVGGGYSAQRNTMQNIGLYGNLPTLMASAQQGTRQSDRSGRLQAARFGERQDQSTTALGMHGTTTAAGAAESAIPVPYRRKVAEYFRRIADEAANDR